MYLRVSTVSLQVLDRLAGTVVSGGGRFWRASLDPRRELLGAVALRPHLGRVEGAAEDVVEEGVHVRLALGQRHGADGVAQRWVVTI